MTKKIFPIHLKFEGGILREEIIGPAIERPEEPEPMRSIHMIFHNRIYRGVGNIIHISAPIKWERLGYGTSIKTFPATDWLSRFILRRKWLRQFLRWRML